MAGSYQLWTNTIFIPRGGREGGEKEGGREGGDERARE